MRPAQRDKAENRLSKPPDRRDNVLMAKMHWKHKGRILCNVPAIYSAIVGPDEWKDVTRYQLQAVTCKRCIKRLLDVGFNIAEFYSKGKGD